MQKQYIEEGFKQGTSKNRLENAKTLIKDDFDRNKIIKSLNLSEEEIKQLEL